MFTKQLSSCSLSRSYGCKLKLVCFLYIIIEDIFTTLALWAEIRAVFAAFFNRFNCGFFSRCLGGGGGGPRGGTSTNTISE